MRGKVESGSRLGPAEARRPLSVEILAEVTRCPPDPDPLPIRWGRGKTDGGPCFGGRAVTVRMRVYSQIEDESEDEEEALDGCCAWMQSVRAVIRYFS